MSAINTKQDILTFDSTPIENSVNPVTSGGVYTAINSASGGYTSYSRGTWKYGCVFIDMKEFPQESIGKLAEFAIFKSGNSENYHVHFTGKIVDNLNAEGAGLMITVTSNGVSVEQVYKLTINYNSSDNYSYITVYYIDRTNTDAVYTQDFGTSTNTRYPAKSIFYY